MMAMTLWQGCEWTIIAFYPDPTGRWRAYQGERVTDYDVGLSREGVPLAGWLLLEEERYSGDGQRSVVPAIMVDGEVEPVDTENRPEWVIGPDGSMPDPDEIRRKITAEEDRRAARDEEIAAARARGRERIRSGQ